MNETQLLRFSLTVAFLGMVTLFFLTKTIAAPTVKIDDITDEFLGKRVSITGTVQELKILKNMTILTLKQEESVRTMPVVAFEPLSFLQENDKILVSGQVKEYHGALEIVAEKVEIIQEKEEDDDD